MPRSHTLVPPRALRAWPALCLALLSLPLLPSYAQDPLPNLRPVFYPTSALWIEGADLEAPSGYALRFETNVLNDGPGALEITGSPIVGGDDPLVAQAEQCLTFSEQGLCEQKGPAGQLESTMGRDYYPQYCYALENIARYELRSVIAGTTTPDMRPQGLLNTTKASFVLEDEGVDYEAPDEAQSAYPHCLPPYLRQGISPGYFESRTGEDTWQFVDVGFRRGFYALVMTLDPQNVIREADEGDNTIVIVVEITGPSSVRIVEIS